MKPLALILLISIGAFLLAAPTGVQQIINTPAPVAGNLLAVTTNSCLSALTSTDSLTCTLNTTNLTSGSMIACFNEGSSTTFSSIADPTNGTYAVAAQITLSGEKVVAYHANTSTASSLVVTLTYTGTAANQLIACQEITGQNASPLDATVCSSTTTCPQGGPTQPTVTTGSYTTAQANEIIFSLCGRNTAAGTLTTTGFTQSTQFTTPTFGMQVAYLIVSSIQSGITTSCTMSPNANTSMVIVAFKAA
jgi:hypothetical protein